MGGHEAGPDTFLGCAAFLDEIKDIAPRIGDHLRSLLADDDDRKKLIIELCAVIDAGEPFVKTTYNLEGDGLLIFTAYSTLREAFQPQLLSATT